METNTRSENVSNYYAHPDYLYWLDTWKKLNDVIDGGADAVKKAGTRYLPATTGQIAQWSTPVPGVRLEDLGGGRYVTGGTGSPGLGAYAYMLYQFRAIFYEYPSDALADMVGRLIYEKAVVELPAGLAELEETATNDKQSFERLVESIYREQGKYSRCAILADFQSSDSVQSPYICIYDALRVVNWKTSKAEDGSEVLDWAVLDESSYQDTGVTWQYEKIIRILALDEAGEYFTQTFNVSNIEDKESFDALNVLEPKPADEEGGAVYPTFRNKKATAIPLVFINATNISATPELPIMNNLTNTSLAIYRGEADYRQALFMQGQATPAFKGVSEDERKKFLLGAQGSVFSNNPDFDAFFMEVSGAGLSEMRESQAELHNLAKTEGMKLVESGANESGEALKQRGAEQTVSLNTMAATCEAGLKRMIELLGEWGGVAGDFTIELNREFNEDAVAPAELKTMIEAYNMGYPLTLEDLHKFAKEGGLTESEWADVELEMLDTGRNPTPEEEEEEAEEEDGAPAVGAEGGA